MCSMQKINDWGWDKLDFNALKWWVHKVDIDSISKRHLKPSLLLEKIGAHAQILVTSLRLTINNWGTLMID